MVNEWTRKDLLDFGAMGSVMDRWKVSYGAVSDVLDAVVEHLNANHPKPVPGMLWATKSDADRWRRAHAIVEQERDQARAERDELKSEAERLFDQCRDRYRERDEAKSERDEWKARAEAAEARTTPAVTRAGVKNAIDTCFALAPKINTQVISDAVCDFLGIEAEPADPVEELAGQIEAATRIAIRRACIDLATVAPPLDPLTIERAMDVTAASRKVAAHVLWQEAGE